jgi:murein DD-endopeptidase MepM/ murein hydrolase activator NlpD
MEAAQRTRVAFSIFAGLFLASCAGPAAQPVAVSAPAIAAPPIVAEAPPPPEPITPTPPPAPVAAGQPVSDPFISCSGQATQGGAILCKANPGATISLDGAPTAIAGADGVALIGLSRSEPPQVKIGVRPIDSAYEASTTVDILPRTDTVAKLTMECNKIAAQTPEAKRRAEVSWVKKDNALKMFAQPLAPIGFIKPADGPYSSPFGATRTYTPKTNDCEPSTSVHNGQDIAIATGTEIRAPMAGTVILADPDLYYEGGCVFLDLGYGLVSVTMHMSRIDVKPGDTVTQGQLLGLSGSTGRVTGPHLHWAIRYRNIHSADRGTDIWLDPILLLGLNFPID